MYIFVSQNCNYAINKQKNVIHADEMRTHAIETLSLFCNNPVYLAEVEVTSGDLFERLDGDRRFLLGGYVEQRYKCQLR